MTRIASGSPPNPQMQPTGRGGPRLRPGAGLLEAKQCSVELCGRQDDRLQLMRHPLGREHMRLPIFQVAFNT